MSVWNGLPYLEHAVRSISRQTFRDFEFIVVDDASSDGSWAVLQAEAAKDPRMVLLQNTANRGFAISQNTGIALARGEYIALQDQDDASHPERLERQINFLKSHPETGAVGVWPRFIDHADQVLPDGSFPLLTDDKSLQHRLLIANCFCGPSLMITRGLMVELGGYDPSFRSAEDYELLLRLAEVTKLANLPERLYSYRQHSYSVSRVRRSEQVRNKALALERAAHRRFGPTLPDEVCSILAVDYLRSAFNDLPAGELELALAAVGKALAYAPGFPRQGTLAEEAMWAHLRREEVADPYTLVASVFEVLLPRTRHLSRVKARLLSGLHMQEVFEGSARSQGEQVDAHWWAGLLADPRWALNRGVWAIGIRRLFGRSRSP
jgi:glycosyltransferase involved in cell wall biosynthesis